MRKVYRRINSDTENALPRLMLPLYYAHTKLQKDNRHRRLKPRDEFHFAGALRPNQVEVFNALVEKLAQQPTAILGLHTGFGKTLLGLYMVYHYRLYTCVLIESKTILDQWAETARTFFPDMRYATVGKSTDEEICGAHVVFCMDRRLSQLTDGSRATPPPARFGLLIVDEAHSFTTTDRIEVILHFNPTYAVALSATPRDTSTKAFKCIELIFGPSSEAIVRKRHRDVVVHKVLTPFSVQGTWRKSKSGYSEMMSKLALNDSRNKLIVDLVCKVIADGRRPLVVVGIIEHLNRLVEMLTQCRFNVGALGGKHVRYDPNCQVLVVTDSKVSQGFDEVSYAGGKRGEDTVIIDQLLDTLIFCSSFHTSVRREQLVGRSRHTGRIEVYHIVDNMRVFHNHYLKSVATYRDELQAKFDVIDFRPPGMELPARRGKTKKVVHAA